MKVLKFGGTSVGSAQRMKDVAKLITGERNIVVLSAMSGTTNSLVEISDYLYKKNPDGANEVINKLAQKYYGHIEELYSTDEYKQKAKELIKHHFDHIRTFTKDLFTLFEEKVVLAQGELISTGMMNLYLNECGINSVLIPALDYMRTDKNAEPDPVYIKEKLIKLLDGNKDADLFITQGYICRNAYGEMQPEAPGTMISNMTEKGKIKAVAAKDNITSIKIKSGRMLLATGFLRKVFEIFENYQTPIDMVTTSEVGVSVTIDNRKHLEEIVDDLKKYGTVTVDEDMVIVCVVGDLEWDNVGFEARIVQAMKDVPVRMISYGGSNYNVSLLIKASDKTRALQALSDHLFNNKA